MCLVFIKCDFWPSVRHHILDIMEMLAEQPPCFHLKHIICNNMLHPNQKEAGSHQPAREIKAAAEWRRSGESRSRSLNFCEL